MQVVTGSRYLGFFIEMEAAQALWLEEKLEGWLYLVAIMARVARKHPKTAYAGPQKSLQQEWYFVQCVTPYIGKAFQLV